MTGSEAAPGSPSTPEPGSWRAHTTPLGELGAEWDGGLSPGPGGDGQGRLAGVWGARASRRSVGAPQLGLDDDSESS